MGTFYKQIKDIVTGEKTLSFEIFIFGVKTYHLPLWFK